MPRAISLFALAVASACRFEPGLPMGTTGDADTDAADGRDGSVGDVPVGDAQVDSLTNVCPVSYTLLFGTHRYRTSIVDSHANVEADCAGDGRHMVTVETTAENDFVRSTLAPNANGGSFFWIGLTWNGSAWVWTDATSLGAYENFSGAVPSGSSSPCVDVSYNSGTWSEFSCNSPPHDSLCECDGP